MSLRAESGATAALVARQDSMLDIALGAESATAFLASERALRGRVLFSADRSRVLVTVADLPPAPAGRTYQLWGIPDGGAPVSLGVFDTGADGSAVVLLDAPAGDYALSAVSEEPAGGSPQPTTTPFLLGDVAQD